MRGRRGVRSLACRLGPLAALKPPTKMQCTRKRGNKCIMADAVAGKNNRARGAEEAREAVGLAIVHEAQCKAIRIQSMNGLIATVAARAEARV